jgi:hypothetical protein
VDGRGGAVAGVLRGGCIGSYRLVRNRQMDWLKIKGAALVAWALLVVGLDGVLNVDGSIIITCVVLPTWLIMYGLDKYLAKKRHPLVTMTDQTKLH